MADKNYLHTAYANSADGTDGFTTVYPNLNLWKNTKTQTITSTGTDRNVLADIYKLDGNTSDIIGKTVTISYDFSITNSTGTWSGIFNPTLGFVNSGKAASNTSLSGSINDTTTITSLSGDSYSIAVVGFPAGTKLTITKLKVEFGTVATPYMQSASEVTTADWPKYVGTYVDTNPVSSTVPSKYGWDKMKYRVYLDGVAVGGSKLLSFDLKNLKAGTTYNVQVSQINGNIESDKSESVAFKTTLTQ